MHTKLVKIDPQQLSATAAQDALAEAGQLIRAGQLVAFPTETVYGLGADALSDTACAAIFAAKGRPADNPLIVHISDLAMLEALAEPTPLALRLAGAFWPGPLTLVMPKRPQVPDIVSAGLPTVGIRWPAHPVAQALIQTAGPIAAPSANLSGRPSPTLAEHVLEDLEGKLPLILDGGAVQIGLESTVVDVCGSRPVLLRPGQLTAEQLAQAAGQAVEYPGRQAQQRPAAPGMKYTHYAPRGEVVLAADWAQALRQRAALQQKYGREPFLILTAAPNRQAPAQARVFWIAEQGDLVTYARNLFTALRLADAGDYAAVVVETVPEQGLGVAIMNRLRKAAGV